MPEPAQVLDGVERGANLVPAATAGDSEANLTGLPSRVMVEARLINRRVRPDQSASIWAGQRS